MPSPDELLADYVGRGAMIKRTKKGLLHTLDLKPIADQVSNDDVAALAAALGDVRHLELDGAAIDDSAIPPLEQLKKLQHLSLQQTAVGDPSVESLRRMQQLKFLLLTGSALSGDGVAELRRAMIGTRVIFL